MPAYTLPVALISPPVVTLPAVTLPVALTVVPACNAPVTLKLVPVAAPMFGVTKLALALTTMLPPPSNAVVTPSVLALIIVPLIAIPLPDVYVWLVLNIAKVILLVPKVIVPVGELTINAVPALTLPLVVKK